MTTAFGVITKALSFQLPPRVMLWGLLNTLNRWFRTGNRRFEFERLYLENPDPWNYHSNPYERRKYERVLACALEWRNACKSALEIGCSVGVFSRMLAGHFDKVTAIDVSKEALAAATRFNHAVKNICFMHRDLQSLNINDQYSVIFCSEVLYYIGERDAQIVCRQLDKHLSAAGVILMVTGVSSNQSDPSYFDGWADILAFRFEQVFKEIVPDPLRPYLITVFSRRP
jgi:2-polyprenyl-3-methyl-5-hydroxy-6-metoxy-1,4-benzoquinol methylase